ncbi:MAG: hypothetical protein KME35_17455 [Aphanocapsa sp. GSE-SYN-MK-11-07L]|jgi:hypothetical protein|nr:hypothetical protein [Aphanocapsa sp. GSE-SYN-MK-11-07L]
MSFEAQSAEITADKTYIFLDQRLGKDFEQKISGGFRSLEGAQMFFRIRGYISTLRKQGIPVLDALRQVFVGNPIFPAVQPE